jgi:nitroimidazol reductase NimA-like FMN-containing flavoprotein (pyridoxamine 5'-phosphate oxidase superfamily)
MKIINAHPGMSQPMTEDEAKKFMSNADNKLLIRIGITDEKGEPKVTPLAFYFDDTNDKIYVTTLKSSKKVHNLRKKNIIGYCVDDPIPPYKGVQGKATVKILEDIDTNIPLAKKLMMKLTGGLDNSIAKWLLTEVEKGNEVILEITPLYFSTWRSAIPEVE